MASGIDRRRFALGSAGLIASANALAAADNSDAPLEANVLRVLFESAETGFDPAQVSDLYSNRVHSHIFEALLGYDPLAVPVRLLPLTAEAMPEVSADFTRLDGAAAARHPLRRRPGVQGQAARARRGRLRVRVQAHLRPRLQEPGVHARSPRKASSASKRSGRVRCATRSRSTTTASPKACARSTATRCSSSWPSRAPASRRRSPRARARRSRARWSRPIATT